MLHNSSVVPVLSFIIEHCPYPNSVNIGCTKSDIVWRKVGVRAYLNPAIYTIYGGLRRVITLYIVVISLMISLSGDSEHRFQGYSEVFTGRILAYSARKTVLYLPAKRQKKCRNWYKTGTGLVQSFLCISVYTCGTSPSHFSMVFTLYPRDFAMTSTDTLFAYKFLALFWARSLRSLAM